MMMVWYVNVGYGMGNLYLKNKQGIQYMTNGFVIWLFGLQIECFMNCSINNNVEGVDAMHSE